jgi:hypothetical protein
LASRIDAAVMDTARSGSGASAIVIATRRRFDAV